jgi:hypothetical protein
MLKYNCGTLMMLGVGVCVGGESLGSPENPATRWYMLGDERKLGTLTLSDKKNSGKLA